MTLPRILGLYSPAPQSGKTTVANYLIRYGYQRVSFAEPIKEMAAVLLENLGYTPAAASYRAHEDKYARIPEIGVTVRHVLQTLGTEWGRECLHPEVWLISWRHRADRALAAGHNVVVDDVRFLNEAELLRGQGAQLWRITRPGVTSPSSHASEGGLDDYSFDFNLYNNASLRTLELAVCQKLGIPHQLAQEVA